MPEQSNITSIEAIESFRASLIVYLSKVRPALEEVSHEVLRARLWLENTQSSHWRNEARARRVKNDEAQQELFRARLSPLQEVSAAQYQLARRTRAALDEAEAKLRVVARWEQDLQNQAQPLAKPVEQALGYIGTDMAKAVDYLGRVCQALEAYAATAPARRDKVSPGVEVALPGLEGEPAVPAAAGAEGELP